MCPLLLFLDERDERVYLLVGELTLEDRHDARVAGDDLRLRLEDRLADVVLVGLDALAGGERHVGAEEALERRAGALGAVEGVAALAAALVVELLAELGGRDVRRLE